VSSEQLTVTIYSGKDCLDSQIVSKYYVYKKRSVSGSDQKLKLSRSKTYYIKVSGEEGTYKLGVSATSPASVKATSTESKKVTVKWSKLNRATGYEIYRAESKNGSYKKIATVKKASTVSYTDTKSLKKGKTYYYKVRAYVKVNGKTYYSDYSSVKSVKVK
jgi:fibronectin type 3 domain-containing protein